MENYTGFAKVYDEMMDNIPYLDWEFYLLHLLFVNGVKPDGKITELGCGTGTMTELLADDGFHITGIDLSEDMLKIAEEKCPEIVFHKMDMREFALKEKQDAIISIADSMNYLSNVDDLTKVMKCVKDALIPGGVFIFDLKTEFFFKEIVRERTFRGKGQGFTYVWKNHYDEEEKYHLYDVSIKHRDEDGKWTIDNEVHKQQVFTGADIKTAAQAAGFKKAKVYGNMTFEKPRKDSERIYVVLRKADRHCA